jgi:hypothetical protein
LEHPLDLLGVEEGGQVGQLPLAVRFQRGEVDVGGQNPLRPFVVIVGDCRESRGELLTDALNVVKMVHGRSSNTGLTQGPGLL